MRKLYCVQVEDRPLTEYLTEQEQIELLKRWVKQYSGVIITGILLAIAISSGWRYWQARQINTLTHASAVFDEMVSMRAQNNEAATLIQANKLFSHYPQTPYGQFAALMIARDAIGKKDYATAATNLNWVIDNSKIKQFRQIARLRLARVNIALNKPADGIKTLETVDDATFTGLIDEVRGDAYAQMKNNTAARNAYKLALAELPDADTARPILQMKYDNLSI